VTRYELLDRIGVGGMAEIFRGKAVAAGGFEKPVAIKRILPHLSQDPRFVELLIAEAKVLSLLKHRNIVQIFDVGLGDDSKYFLVMEYVDGKDLGAVQRSLEAQRTRLPFDIVLHLIAEVCEALEHAHTARAPDGKQMALVHRDISPSNVLLSRAGEIKLTDFGIAKRAESEHTGHGSVRGKFAYISPEQARNEHISPRSDVFAVGILLWELLTNRRLFSGLDDLGALRAVRDANVQPPSSADPRLPRAVDAIVMAALAPDSRGRPTAGQLGQQLRSLRYSLDDTSGDPATELAKVIDEAEQAERKSKPIPGSEDTMTLVSRANVVEQSDPAENTVIRIRTADAFSERNDRSISMARSVIDRFEEEETRMAQLSGDQLKQLRSRNPQDSQELSAVTPPRPPARSRRVTDEPTMFRQPVAPRPGPPAPDDDDGDSDGDGDGPTIDAVDPADSVNGHYAPEENTRFIAPRTNARTPVPGSLAAPRQPSTSRPPPPGRAQRPPPSPSRPPGGDAMPVMQTLQGNAPPQSPSQQQQQQHPGFMTTAPLPPPGFQQPGYPTPAPGYGPPPYQNAYPPPAGYPMFNPGGPERMQRAATPTSPDTYDRPTYTPTPTHLQGPPVSGFHAQRPSSPLKPWMLVVGALLMAALAFLLTRACIH
jgi:serine/threonine protein kinase